MLCLFCKFLTICDAALPFLSSKALSAIEHDLWLAVSGRMDILNVYSVLAVESLQ